MGKEQTAEMIERAMLGQKRAVKCCELIWNAVSGYRDKELIAAIKREERRHYYLLEGIYEDVTGEECSIPQISVALPRQLNDMLRLVLCDKLMAIEHYEALQKELTCPRNRDLLEMILCDQKEHARIFAMLYRKT